MASMEGLLMEGSFSDSDSDAEDNAGKAAGAPAASSIVASTTAAAVSTAPHNSKQQPPPVVAPTKPSGVTTVGAAPAAPKQPTPAVAAPKPVVGGASGAGTIQRSNSKSTLTNRLKSLYTTPAPSAVPVAKAQPKKTTGGAAPIQVAGTRNVAPPPAAASSSSSSRAPPPPGVGNTMANNPNGYVPPMVHMSPAASHRGSPQRHQQQQKQQQQQQQRHVLSSSRTGSIAPIVNIPPTVGPPPPSPMTTANQHSQQQGQQPHGALNHAPHLQRGSRPQQHRQTSPHHQQQQRQPIQALPSNSRTTAPNVAPPQRSPNDPRIMTDQEKKRFLMFTKVLMKYLEQRDAGTHAKAKAAIEECYAKNKAGDPQYKSLTTSMKARLRATVGESYWKRAHDYLDVMLKQKRAKLHQHQQNILRAQQLKQQQAAGRQVQQQPLQPHPQQQVISASPSSQQSASVHAGAPPPIVRTVAPQPPQNTQQHLAAPVQSQSVTPQSAATDQSKPLTEKQQADERRARKNANARKKRAEKKKEKERLEAAAKAQRTSKVAAPANSGASTIATTAPAGLGAALSVGAVTLPTGAGLQRQVQPSTSVLSNASVVGSARPPSATSSVTTASTVTKTKDKKVDPLVQKKNIKKKATSTASKPPSTVVKRKSSSTKDPNRLMETVDHAILIDVKSLPTLLSKEHKLDFNLEEEQRILLYGDEERCAKVKDIAKAAAALLDANTNDSQLEKAGVRPLPCRIPSMFKGWGERNVVSVRNAWATVRLPEGEAQRVEREREAERVQSDNSLGMISSTTLTDGDASGELSTLSEDPVLSSPTMAPSKKLSTPSTLSSKTQGYTTAPRIEDDTTNHVWYNETRAEQDPTLALISEATELFLKSNIEKMIGQARLRQNLDGVRLWHTLHAHSSANRDTGNDTDNRNPSAALIRLGCDVRRQIALAEGNAARTYQRMEMALSHQDDSSHNNSDTMLLEATSMADLSKKVPLKSAANVADTDAKRKYAIFGGIDSQEPPFGRVPKKVKVMLQDVVVGELGNRTSMIGSKRKRFRVGLRY